MSKGKKSNKHHHKVQKYSTEVSVRAKLREISIGTVVLPFYGLNDYEIAQDSIEGFKFEDVSYDEYITEFLKAAEEAIDRHGVVIISVVSVMMLMAGAQYLELDAADSHVQRAYLEASEKENLYPVHSQEDLLLVFGRLFVNGWCLSVMTDMVLDQSGGDELDESVGRELMDLNEEVMAKGGDFLETLERVWDDNVSSIGHVEIHVRLDGNEWLPTAILDLERGEDGISVHGGVDQEFLFSATRVGYFLEGRVTVLIFDGQHAGLEPGSICDGCGTTIGDDITSAYGIVYTDGELRGLNEAEVFDELCTDSDGDPMPPLPAIEPRSLDITRYVSV
jgi:hypothetical protein